MTRVLIISLSTYSSPHNDGKLEQLGLRTGSITAAAGDVETIWGQGNHSRSGPGYEVVVLPVRFTRTKATRALVGLDDLAKKTRPALIHIECEPWQAVAVQSVRLARKLRVPVGIQFAEAGPLLTGASGALRKALGARVLARCDYAVGWSSPSTRVAEQLAPRVYTETFPATGVSVQPPEITPPDEWFGAGSESLPKVVFAGRFLKEKGIEDFLSAADELAGRLPIRVAIAGGQGMEDLVRHWAQERPWAHLHGMLPRSTVGSLLAAADVLVCPSRTTRSTLEQFGKAPVEAMAAGTPVFAYDCGALAEVIGAGGVVVAEGAQTQLVDALQSYFSGPETDRAFLTEEARKQAMEFTDGALADKLLSLWSRYDGKTG